MMDPEKQMLRVCFILGPVKDANPNPLASFQGFSRPSPGNQLSYVGVRDRVAAGISNALHAKNAMQVRKRRRFCHGKDSGFGEA